MKSNRQRTFEGWHYHASFGVVTTRQIWGQDLQKTYPTAELTLPTPTTQSLSEPDSEHDMDSDTSYIPTEHDLSLISDTSSLSEYSDEPSFCSSTSSSSSRHGVDFVGLGLYGVVFSDPAKSDGRIHLRSHHAHISPTISQTTLDEVYATFCDAPKLKPDVPTRALTRTQSQPAHASSKTMTHSRSTVSSELKRIGKANGSGRERARTWR